MSGADLWLQAFGEQARTTANARPAPHCSPAGLNKQHDNLTALMVLTSQFPGGKHFLRTQGLPSTREGVSAL